MTKNLLGILFAGAVPLVAACGSGPKDIDDSGKESAINKNNAPIILEKPDNEIVTESGKEFKFQVVAADVDPSDKGKIKFGQNGKHENIVGLKFVPNECGNDVRERHPEVADSLYCYTVSGTATVPGKHLVKGYLTDGKSYVAAGVQIDARDPSLPPLDPKNFRGPLFLNAEQTKMLVKHLAEFYETGKQEGLISPEELESKDFWKKNGTEFTDGNIVDNYEIVGSGWTVDTGIQHDDNIQGNGNFAFYVGSKKTDGLYVKNDDGSFRQVGKLVRNETTGTFERVYYEQVNPSDLWDAYDISTGLTPKGVEWWAQRIYDTFGPQVTKAPLRYVVDLI